MVTKAILWGLLSPLFFLSQSAWAYDWAHDAERLTGESDYVRAKSIAQLKQHHLQSSLEAALSSARKFQALDVIATLHMSEMLPALLKQAEHDQDGTIFLTLNQITTPDSADKIFQFYHEQLFRNETSIPAKVVIVDTFSRTNQKLSLIEINALLQNPWPEVQSSALNYIRYSLLRKNNASLPFLKRSLDSKFRQIRQQAAYILSETPEGRKPENASYVSSPPGAGIKVHIAFGYKDARPARFVGDRYERLALIQAILKPCETTELICGFTRNDDDADLFSKSLPTQKILYLRISASSAGPDDSANRVNPYQNELSVQSRRGFLSALQDYDIVFYNGHSRDGGGPDFFPPRLTKDDHVDYKFYTSNKPGVKAIAATGNMRAKELALLSCSSKTEFTSKELKLPAQTKLITVPGLLYYSDAIALLQKTLTTAVQQNLAATTR